MYPHVIQFKSRDRLLAQQLELLRIRKAAAARAGANPIWRRFRQSPKPLSSPASAH